MLPFGVVGNSNGRGSGSESSHLHSVQNSAGVSSRGGTLSHQVRERAASSALNGGHVINSWTGMDMDMPGEMGPARRAI